MVITGNIIRREESTIPNHIKNVLKFKKLKQEDINFIINTITIKAEDDSGYWIDFDKIIPEPKIESDCPDDCKTNSESHVEEDKDRPWFDWYTWHNKYWGTKWGAYDCYSIISKSYITLIFTTAWRTPYPIIEQLHVMGYQFELKYADEAYGSNCGKIIFNPDETGFRDIVHVTSESLANPETFAKYLWDRY